MEETRRGHRIEIVETELGFAASQFPAPNAKTTGFEPQFEAEAPSKRALLIDGELVEYMENGAGFWLGYLPPKDTLEEAAREYVDHLREAGK